LGEARGHLLEALGEMSDLAAARHAWDLDVTPPFGHVVGDPRELPHRLRDPAREVDGEEPRGQKPAEEREPQASDERDHPRPELVPRPRGDEPAAELLLRPEEDRLRDRDVRLVLAGRDELELDRLPAP